MAEDELLRQLKSLYESNQIERGIELLVTTMGKGKIIDPLDTRKMETIWGFFANPLLAAGRLEDFIKIYRQMNKTLLKLQRQDDARYHKGLPLYSIGHGLLRQAFQFFLYSYVEDTINQKKFPEGLPSISTLQGIFKVDSEFLQQLSEVILEKMPDARDPNEALVKLGVKMVPVELWMLEYQMQQIETKLRRFIESKLSSVSTEWWEKLIPEEIRKNVERRIRESSKVLWFSEQPMSPLDYLLFPREYIEIIINNECWKHFESVFKHKAIIEGKLVGLGHIRNKIAHYRKISDREKQMFEEAIKWLDDRLKYMCVQKIPNLRSVR